MRRMIAMMAAASLVAVASCEDGAPTEAQAESSAPFALATVSGDSQAGTAGRLLDGFLVFRVTDAGGKPVPGLRVRWEVVSGGGKVSGKRHETDVEGLGAGNFTLGPEPGKHVARATIQDSLAIEFTAFAGPPRTDEEETR